MASTKTKLTYETYLRTPDDKRYELLDGELIMEPAPLTAHQYVQQSINASCPPARRGGQCRARRNRRGGSRQFRRQRWD